MKVLRWGWQRFFGTRRRRITTVVGAAFVAVLIGGYCVVDQVQAQARGRTWDAQEQAYYAAQQQAAPAVAAPVQAVATAETYPPASATPEQRNLYALMPPFPSARRWKAVLDAQTHQAPPPQAAPAPAPVLVQQAAPPPPVPTPAPAPPPAAATEAAPPGQPVAAPVQQAPTPEEQAAAYRQAARYVKAAGHVKTPTTLLCGGRFIIPTDCVILKCHRQSQARRERRRRARRPRPTSPLPSRVAVLASGTAAGGATFSVSVP